VEEVLKLHDGVEDCTVVGVPDATWGQAITAVVQVVPGRTVEPRALIDHARTRLAAYKAPKHVVCVERIVRSPAGKADYRWALDRAKAALGVG
jgi:acyl-CoA synthetase (AMP-forming)/AMP-acid ligase II